MKLVIDRQKWLRGEGTLKSFLLRKADGKQCCIGIFAESCGVERERLEQAKTLTFFDIKSIPEAMLFLKDKTGLDSSYAYALYVINDTFGPEDEREHKVATEFAKHGVEVEFIN